MTKKPRWLVILLLILPLWLIGSGAYAVWKNSKKILGNTEQEKTYSFRKEIKPASLWDDYQKILTRLSGRNLTNPTNLLAMSSMLQGSAGPSNIGYQVSLIPLHHLGENKTLSIIHFQVSAEKPNAPHKWLIIPYDESTEKNAAQTHAASLSISLAVAQALVGKNTSSHLHFLYVPCAFAQDEELVKKQISTLRKTILTEKSDQVLTYHWSNALGELHLITQDVEMPIALQHPKLLDQETAQRCMEEAGAPHQLLFESGLPAAALIHGSADEETTFSPPNQNALSTAAKALLEIVEKL